MSTSLRLTENHYQAFNRHLYPGDGLEAVAIALCGRHRLGRQHWLMVNEIYPIPYELCHVRTATQVCWSTEILETLLKKATRYGFGFLKIHSHPSGYNQFSATDDQSDRDLFGSIHGWLDDNLPHVSAVMLPDGTLFGRSIDEGGNFQPLDRITVVGDDPKYWDCDAADSLPEFTLRHAQAFGKGTTLRMQTLKAAVVGCSGTGGPLIEMLVRLGIGEIILIDPKLVGYKNLNRIPNTTMIDVLRGRPKVEAIAEAMGRIGLGTKITPIHGNIDNSDVIAQIATCDVIFGCVDTINGRDILNAISTFYLIPYFDLGVRLDADGLGGIEQIFGTVHYLQPGLSSLRTRGVYTSEQLHAELIKHADPTAYKEQFESGYLASVEEDRPAVISVNTQIAAMAVNEFLARLHPYRDDPNSAYAVHRVSLNQGAIYKEPEGPIDPYLARFVGRGAMRPLLNMPRLQTEAEYHAMA